MSPLNSRRRRSQSVATVLRAFRFAQWVILDSHLDFLHRRCYFLLNQMGRRPSSIRVQQQFAFARRGGRRPGAGRKPKGDRAGVSHRTREALAARFPVHVTVRLERGLPGSREKQTYRAVKRVFAAGSDRFGFRLTQYSRCRGACRDS